MRGVMDRWIEMFGPDALSEAVARWLPSVAVALGVLLLFWTLSVAIRRVLTLIFARTGYDPTAGAFVQTIVRTSLMVIGLLTALDQVGVNVTSILASLGILGLTVGFAAQNTLSNVISGLFIFWDRPFVLSDLVEVDGHYGKVVEITMRSTRVVTPDGRMLAIPNNVIANATVASYTNFPNLRLDIPVGIGVNEPVGKAREALLALVRQDPRFLDDPAPVVLVRELGDYAVTIELRAWLKDETTHVAVRAELREAVKDALDAAGVAMPFETLALAPLTVHEAPAAP